MIRGLSQVEGAPSIGRMHHLVPQLFECGPQLGCAQSVILGQENAKASCRNGAFGHAAVRCGGPRRLVEGKLEGEAASDAGRRLGSQFRIHQPH